LLYGKSEAIGEIGTTLEATVCFLLLTIRDNDNNILGESINVSGTSNKTVFEYTKNGIKSKKQKLIHIDNGE
jgi:hypothetical protein